MTASDFFVVRQTPDAWDDFAKKVAENALLSATIKLGGQPAAGVKVVVAGQGKPGASPEPGGAPPTGVALPIADGGAGGAGLPPPPPAPPTASGGFTSIQSLVTFSGATTAIQLAGLVITLLFHLSDDAKRTTVALLAAVVGLLLFVINVTTPDARPKGVNAWTGASLVAFFNTVTLVAAAIGVNTVTTPPQTGNGG